jgi:hypothetical protein
MKILLLYVPRSGSTSILRYFKSVNPNYNVVNQPWSELVAELTKSNMINYKDLIKDDNIFIKSDIGSFIKENINLESVKSDFDKIIILDRKDKEKQMESLIHAKQNNSFLESNKYWFDCNSNYTIEDNEIIKSEKGITELKNQIPILTKILNAKLYYYEDLFFGDFSDILDYLEMDYNVEYFNLYLDKKNKYRLGDNIRKENKSLL